MRNGRVQRSAPPQQRMNRSAPLGPQMLMLTRALLASAQRGSFLMLVGALFVVIGATAFSQVRLNAWNQPFYDALQRKDASAFLHQLLVFAVLACLLLCLNVAQRWLNEMTKVQLRAWLVSHLFDVWLRPRRALRLADAGEIGANPDQRMHEDARHLSELTTDLGMGLLQSTLLLASFIGVLWILSAQVSFDLHGRTLHVPGYMVWSALLYAGAASWLSWHVGRPLIPLQEERYGREAELRYALVRVAEHVDSITLQRGEADERQRLEAELKTVVGVTRRIVHALARLTWVTAGYGWFTIIAPILVAAPGFFGGHLTFGGMMMAVGAFIQVQQALRWFVDNFSTIADWRATLLRITRFSEALGAADEIDSADARITLVETPEEKVVFDGLAIAFPTGCARLGEARVEISPGERVLVVGQQGVGKTLLFRSIAGLWPWGEGRIELPPSPIAFVSRRPYVPPGTLRAALAYPKPAMVYSNDELVRALHHAGLERLASSLDRSARWHRELSEDEQQCVVLARLLLQKPLWVVIDAVLDWVQEDVREHLLQLMRTEFSATTIIHIGRNDSRYDFFTRVVRLVKDPQGQRLTGKPSLPAAAQSEFAAGSS